MKSVPLASQNSVEFTASLPLSQHSPLEPLHSWICVQRVLHLGRETRQIGLGMLQLIAENPQAGRSSGYRSSTAHTLLRQGHQFLGSRTAIMGSWLRS